jgi:predicted dehydrogenase
MDKIRVGLIGANPDRGWSAATHLPALAALEDFELAAVCTSRAESAAAAADRFGARYAVVDPAELVASDAVDLVVVSVRAPGHAALVVLAVQDGKPVFCEWPLGSNVDETRRLCALAGEHGVRTFVGLQGHASPGALHARALIADNYVGEILSVTMTGAHTAWGAVMLPTADYVADAANGVTVPTILGGHTIDMLCALAGELVSVSGIVANRRREVRSSVDGSPLAKTAPDQFLFTAILVGGAPVAVHLQGGACDKDAFALEVRGTAGTLRLATDYVPEILPPTLTGTQTPGATLAPIEIPHERRSAPESLGNGPAVNVAQLYASVAADLRDGGRRAPDFAHALRRRETIEAIGRSSDSGRRFDLR